MGLSNNLAQNPDPGIAWPIGSLIVIGLLSCVVGFILSAFTAQSSPEASADQPSLQPTALPQSPPTMRLPPERRPEPMPSVTEHTTVRLEPPHYETSRSVVQESKE
ncbi:MAG: hypothetical protein HY314_01375 [Acidobacteria bacterium]|nr:hypothetical protein [Acidobacteriota bacterium]